MKQYALFTALALIVICAARVQAADPINFDSVKTITLYTNGQGGLGHSEKIFLKTANHTLYKREIQAGGKNLSQQAVMSDAQWEKLKADLKKSNIESWEASSMLPGVQDGVQWSLEILFNNDAKIIKSGSNKFPTEFKQTQQALNQFFGS